MYFFSSLQEEIVDFISVKLHEYRENFTQYYIHNKNIDYNTVLMAVLMNMDYFV